MLLSVLLSVCFSCFANAAAVAPAAAPPPPLLLLLPSLAAAAAPTAAARRASRDTILTPKTAILLPYNYGGSPNNRCGRDNNCHRIYHVRCGAVIVDVVVETSGILVQKRHSDVAHAESWI